jgi:hypothetical protein
MLFSLFLMKLCPTLLLRVSYTLPGSSREFAFLLWCDRLKQVPIATDAESLVERCHLSLELGKLGLVASQRSP